MRAGASIVLALCVVGCTKPRPTAEPPRDAAIVDASAVDSGTLAKVEAPETPSIFSLVARAPVGRISASEQGIASALPFVARLPDGGLVVVSEYGRAVSHDAGPLAVSVALDEPKDFEFDVYFRPGDVQGAQLLRWVWSDGTASVVTAENQTMRNGPEVDSRAYGPKGFWHVSRSSGYWSAVMREGSVMALERVTYEIPNPMYEHPTDTASVLKPARVAVLAGKASPPVIPAGVCPLTMAAGPDGAVIVIVDKCGDEKGAAKLGLLRYAPKATTAKLEWVATTAPDPGESAIVAVAVASANEIYVGHGGTIDTWNGKQWTATTPFDGDRVVSLSAGTDGALWAVARARDEGGYLTVRKPGADKWEEVALPKLPTTPLDDVYWSDQVYLAGNFHKIPKPDYEGGAFTLRKVDAAGEEILVLGAPTGFADMEAYIFSTKKRTPVAKIPSIAAQRVQLAKTFARKTTAVDKPGKGCSTSFLMFPEGTKAEALGIGPSDGGFGQLSAAEATVEGALRVVIYGNEVDLAPTAKRLEALSPKRVCGPPVIERDY